jgi:hypothetical protein
MSSHPPRSEIESAIGEREGRNESSRFIFRRVDAIRTFYLRLRAGGTLARPIDVDASRTDRPPVLS